MIAVNQEIFLVDQLLDKINYMLNQMQKQQSKTAENSSEDFIVPQPEEIAFAMNTKMIGVIILIFSFLYMSLEQHRARYFVYISITTNIIYPLFRIQKEDEMTFRKILYDGSFITSLLYDLWTLMYPHKVFIYYIPQLLGTVGKIYHILTYQDEENTQSTVEQLIKFQSKSQLFVIIYSLLYFILKLKYSWWKLMKLFLLLVILRIKYSFHKGTKESYQQVHFMLDRYSKYLSVRQYYQILYLKISLLYLN